MKRIFYSVILIISVLIAAFTINFTVKEFNCFIDDLSRTEMQVVNSTDSSVVVCLALAVVDTNYHVTDVNGIFGIKEGGLKGSFVLKAGDTVKYIISEKVFFGNITFATDTNKFEFSSENNWNTVDTTTGNAKLYGGKITVQYKKQTK